MRTNRRARSAYAAVVIVLSAASSLLALACASLLDIKELPLAPAESGVAVDAGIDAATDACPPRGNTFCTQQCPVPDFCDDFEGPRLAENWEPPLGFQNPLITGTDGHVFLERDDAGTQSRALFADALSTSSDSANAVVLHSFVRQVAGRKLRGARMRLDVRVPALSFANDGGKPDNLVTFLAFGSAGVNQGIGVAIFVDNDTDFRLGIQQRSLGPGKFRSDLIPEVLNAARENFGKNYLPVDVTVGTPDLLRERKIACTLETDGGVPDDGGDAGGSSDGGPDTTMRMVIQFGQAARKCALLQDVLATPEWLASGAFIVGASVTDFGSTSLRIDNIALYLYE